MKRLWSALSRHVPGPSYMSLVATLHYRSAHFKQDKAPMDLTSINPNVVRDQHPAAFAALGELLYQAKPLLVNPKTASEYEREVASIIIRLWDCATIIDVQEVVHEAFVVTVGPEAAGTAERYENVAHRIWDELPAWFEFPLRRPSAAA
jgi:hypothetical protein